MIRPTKVYFTKGTGVHKEDKNANDAASDMANLGDFNLVSVTSILPRGVKILTKEEFLAEVEGADILFAIHGVCQTNIEGQIASAGLAYVLPEDESTLGYITELFESPGIHPDILKKRVETMALQLYATRTRVQGFVADDVYEPGKVDYEIGGKKVKLGSLIAYEYGKGDGNYTSVLVAAVLLP